VSPSGAPVGGAPGEDALRDPGEGAPVGGVVATRSVVAIGGGHGLAATLSAARRLPVALTAVVSVADDGGSSGRLRAEADQPAPGDLRRCLLALADRPSALTRVMEHRYESGELKGHSFGNLLLATMVESEGDLLAALHEVSTLLGTVGRVLPATTACVELVGTLEDGTDVLGQAAVVATAGLRSVRLEPVVAACGPALDAIAGADTVLLGPGSLYTSVLAAAAVPGIIEAIAASGARVVYICNLHPQPRETEGYSAVEHVAALARHGLHPDVVVYDPDCIGPADGVAGALAAPVADLTGLAHDAERLAAALRPLVCEPLGAAR